MSDPVVVPPFRGQALEPLIPGGGHDPSSGVSGAAYWQAAEQSFAAWKNRSVAGFGDWSPGYDYLHAVDAGFVSDEWEGYATWQAWRELHAGDGRWVGHEDAVGFRAAMYLATRWLRGDGGLQDLAAQWVRSERNDAQRGFRAPGYDPEKAVIALDAVILQAARWALDEAGLATDPVPTYVPMSTPPPPVTSAPVKLPARVDNLEQRVDKLEKYLGLA